MQAHRDAEVWNVNINFGFVRSARMVPLANFGPNIQLGAIYTRVNKERRLCTMAAL